MAEFFPLIAVGWDSLRVALGGFICFVGALMCIVGTIGVLRFPDFYTRLHAASITDTSGAGLVILGMALMAPNWLVLVKLFCILGFLMLTSVTGSHAVANAAHTAGLQPRIGPVGPPEQDHHEENGH